MKPYYSDSGIDLYHGDCLAVMASLPSESIDFIVPDPPYGIDYQSAWRTDRSTWKPKIANDKAPFVWWAHQAFRLAASDSCCLCFCRWDVQEPFRLAMEWSGFDVKAQVVWDREAHGMGDLNGSPAPMHDVLWFGTKGKYAFPGSRPKSVVRSMRLSGEALEHPNQKPLPLMQSLVCDYCREGGTILDPFAGSGTTLVAAKLSGHKAIGIEIDEANCELTARRLAQGVLFGVPA